MGAIAHTDVNDHDFRIRRQGYRHSLWHLRYPGQPRLCVPGNFPRNLQPSPWLLSARRWWQIEGQQALSAIRPTSLILADYRRQQWGTARAPGSKNLQRQLCDRLRTAQSPFLTTPPAPPNGIPIEHRLFSQISKNWAAEPLDSYESALKFIRTTTTKTGLKVESAPPRSTTYYPTGVKVPKQRSRTALSSGRRRVLPKWNYTLARHQKCRVIFARLLRRCLSVLPGRPERQDPKDFRPYEPR